jgi:hypothetical protein
MFKKHLLGVLMATLIGGFALTVSNSASADVQYSGWKNPTSGGSVYIFYHKVGGVVTRTAHFNVSSTKNYTTVWNQSYPSVSALIQALNLCSNGSYTYSSLVRRNVGGYITAPYCNSWYPGTHMDQGGAGLDN